MSKKTKKKKNPKGEIFGLKTDKLKLGAFLGLGAVAARAAVNNLPLPEALVGTGIGGAAGTVLAGFGLSLVAKRFEFAKAYADDIIEGATALAVYQLVAPQALPMLAFTDQAKLHASVEKQAQTLLENAKKQIAMQAAGQTGGQTAPNGVGDAFVLSRGGISTADRSPRDQMALAGVGDAYAQERPGFAGAPNNLRAPWSRSIYNRR